MLEPTFRVSKTTRSFQILARFRHKKQQGVREIALAYALTCDDLSVADHREHLGVRPTEADLEVSVVVVASLVAWLTFYVLRSTG